MLNVMLVEDDLDLRSALEETLSVKGYKVRAYSDGKSALGNLEDDSVDIVVSDVQMEPMNGTDFLKNIKKQLPEMPVIMMTAYGSVQDAVDSLKNGACDYIEKPFDCSSLIDAINRYSIPRNNYEEGKVICRSEKSRKVFDLAGKISKSNATVMISGESGTGKEVISRFIHENSPRSAKPFVAINCAAIPENMLEATLFGYEKGAFTGAYQARPGKFEQAQGGTLLLDEISEMDLSLQAKLLRVIQEREVERLGGKKTIDLDVRIIATTNRNLIDYVKEGKFREDLYYRLNVFPIKLPPLRERREDIIDIALNILERISNENNSTVIGISPGAEKALTAYAWPGNIRELDNVVQRACLLSDGREISMEDLDLCESLQGVVREEPEGDINLKAEEYRIVRDVLEKTGGNRKQAAEKLGISERTLRYKIAKMKEYGIAGLK